jgi:hypothetical protein
MLSPIFAASLVAIVVNDAAAHPVVRMLLDVAAVSGAVTLVLLLPEMAAALALIPVGDLFNRFLDDVKDEVERIEEEEHVRQRAVCREARPMHVPC